MSGHKKSHKCVSVELKLLTRAASQSNLFCPATKSIRWTLDFSDRKKRKKIKRRDNKKEKRKKIFKAEADQPEALI